MFLDKPVRSFGIILWTEISFFKMIFYAELLPTTVEPPVSDHPKCQDGGGRLREVVAYESLDHNGSKFFHIRI